MGPRSEDCGYDRSVVKAFTLFVLPLQWVHGPRTVVMSSTDLELWEEMEASMGPRSEDCGYVRLKALQDAMATGFNGSTVRGLWLWDSPPRRQPFGRIASMGPRSEDCGYEEPFRRIHGVRRCFNGSTVRGLWLWQAFSARPKR